MSDNTKREDWTKPAAMAIPKGGYFEDKIEQGRYGPIFPEVSGWLRILGPGEDHSRPGRSLHKYAKTIEETVAAQPDALAVLQLHYLRWVLFRSAGELYFMYQGIFDTDFDKYTEDAVKIFLTTGLRTVFVNLEGFPEDWKTNLNAVIKFVRDHQCPSFLEYGGISLCGADGNQEGLKVKAALSTMLDQMQ